MDWTAAQEPETNHEVAGESDGSALRTVLLRKRKVSKRACSGANAATANVGFRVLRVTGEWGVRPDFSAKRQEKEESLIN